MKREFLQLAHNIESHPKTDLTGWLMSEKLDGQRAWWDGGITRGLWADEVPWANVAKDSRLLHRPRATGLWSRYGKVIHAPDGWLDMMPFMSLDGELYLGPGKHQQLRSAISKQVPVDSEWGNVDFMVFDSPNPSLVLQEGEINNPNFKKTFTQETLIWFLNQYEKKVRHGGPKFASEQNSVFLSRYNGLTQRIPQGCFAKLLPQTILSQHWRTELEGMRDKVVRNGGEGVIVRSPYSLWTPKRIKDCLKVKPGLDSEAEVIGYTWGRETDKGSKLLGLMGALIVRWNNIEFELSGFTDEERQIDMTQGNSREAANICVDVDTYYRKTAGEKCDLNIWTNPFFPIGSQVTFLYRELTDAGIPKEARYFRKRTDE